ncbi:hypothetical protein O181_050697 [Austropuccinia psidii MF-1]|uniref:Uncharacterized protein n=1 Tax=Austropuccinia psidii MF-1 TaxID=1389203 RepID=A0A9Q3DZG7_9BASI|nr:hypothetical protein [Austropuccinia psidii MF-1]
MIKIFGAYGLEFRYPYGFTQDWCTPIPALEVDYKASMHSLAGKTPSMLEKNWNPRLPYDTLKKDCADIHQTTRSFNLTLDEPRNDASKCMKYSLKYAKERRDRINKEPDIK